jgi:hypothetical protein
VRLVWLATLPLRDVDETGRVHMTVWRDPEVEGRYMLELKAGAEAVRLVLEPGFMLDRATAADRAEIRRLFEARGATIAEALEAGLGRVE